jgi:hypothetical protein
MEGVAAGIAASVEIARTTQETMSRNARMQLRAYVSVRIGVGVFQEREKNLRFAIHPQIVNTGFSPARKLTYRAKAEIFPHPLPDDVILNEPTDTLRAEAVLGSHQDFAANAILEYFVPDDEVAEIKRVAARRVYIWGTVSYEDVFGTAQFTNFCHSIYWFRDATNPENELVAGNYARRHNDAS